MTGEEEDGGRGGRGKRRTGEEEDGGRGGWGKRRTGEEEDGGRGGQEGEEEDRGRGGRERNSDHRRLSQPKQLNQQMKLVIRYIASSPGSPKHRGKSGIFSQV